ncbi:DUF72 domain-containing protein [Ilumatobacter coccineus]|nr:DUF72 domain-containing protein [Ilumatobacter coccineus]
MTDVGDPSSAPVLRVGCPMWAHQPWVGTYLSPGNKGRELAEYSRRCNAVEGNTTFYAEPNERTVARWTEQAHPDFSFVFKLPRTITHEHRLRATDTLVASFLDRIEPLGDRIGPVHIQLPPSLGPDSIATLDAFCRSLSRHVAWVVELRHAGFFAGGAQRAVDELLARHHIGRVVLDTRPLYAAPPRSEASLDERTSKPKLPVLVDHVGRSPVIRVIGQDDPTGTLDGLRTWVPQIVAWLDAGREPYLFVHQPENLDSPRLAREIHAEVAALRPDLAPLPEPLPIAPRSEIVGQDSLFS